MPPETRRTRPGRDSGGFQDRRGDVGASVRDAADIPRCRRCHKPLHTDLAIKIGLGGKCASLAIARAGSGRVAAAVEGQQTLPLDVVEVVS